MAVALTEPSPHSFAVRPEGVVVAKERHVRRVVSADVDVSVELLDNVIETERADPLIGGWRRVLGPIRSHRPAGVVGLADARRVVPRCLNHPGYRGPFGRAVADEVAEDAVVVRKPPGEHRGAGRLADRALGPRVGAAQSLAREPIEMRRDHHLVPCAPEHISAMLIGVEKENVRSTLAHEVAGEWPRNRSMFP